MGLSGSSATAQGSSRLIDIRQEPPYHSRNPAPSSGIERGGRILVPGFHSNSSNWGLNGDALSNAPVYKQMNSAYRVRAGAMLIDPVIPWTYTPATPYPAKFNFPCSFYAVECMLAWPTDTAGVDNGLFFSLGDFTRVVTQAGAGCEIWNNNGQLTWTMRGQITEAVALNTGVSIREWQKFRVEFVWLSSQTDPTITLLVNDVLTLSRGAGQVPVGPANFGVGLGVLDNTNYVYWNNLTFIAGPNGGGTV